MSDDPRHVLMGYLERDKNARVLLGFCSRLLPEFAAYLKRTRIWSRRGRRNIEMITTDAPVTSHRDFASCSNGRCSRKWMQDHQCYCRSIAAAIRQDPIAVEVTVVWERGCHESGCYSLGAGDADDGNLRLLKLGA